MNDSQITARSLSESAEMIDKSVTKVASLIKTRETVGSRISLNPAATSKGDSGFKILKAPVETAAVPKNEFKPLVPPQLSEPKPVKPVESVRPEFKPTAFIPNGSNALMPSSPTLAKPASGDFKPLNLPANSDLVKPTQATDPKPTPFVSLPKKKSVLPRLDDSVLESANPVESQSSKTSSDFKPFGIYKPKSQEPPLKLPSFGESKSDDEAKPKPDANTREPVRLPALPEQSLNDLRSNRGIETGNRPTNVQRSEVKSDVKQVSFESAVWTVKKGDSFWSIAQSNYGDGRFFRALYELNRRAVPGFEDLTEGVELKVPPAEELVRRFPELCPSDAVHKNDPWRATPNELMEELTDCCDDDLHQRLYETGAKDTLFEIARRQLGQASRYAELIELNRFRIGEDVSHETLLPAGIKILLPAN